MSGEVQKLAGMFVDLSLKKGEHANLNKQEINILLEIVLAAGFNAKNVVSGKLSGHYLDQDNEPTANTYPINVLLPYKVIDIEGNDYVFATGWLDCLYCHTALLHSISRENKIKNVAKEILRSCPLEPIMLNNDGDLLTEPKPRPNGSTMSNYLVDHINDQDVLSMGVGIHDFCGGAIHRFKSTEDQDTLVCQQCSLRVIFPKSINTYGELREYLDKKLSK